MSEPIRAPFPWFGGKSRAADLVWAAIGDDIGAYCEPFAGSLACLLARPRLRGVETVNDLDAYLVNFWRATRADPAAVVSFAEGPASELDLEARHRWLVTTGGERIARLRDDPDAYDAKVAGWWLWGLCLWIGSGWCVTGKAQAPGIPKGLGKAPRADRSGLGRQVDKLAVLTAIAERLRHVRILCGDWNRALSEASLAGTQRSPTGRVGRTGVLLDPPYPRGEDLYGVDASGVCRDVWRWAEEHGEDRTLRIVVCGHEGDWAPPKGWQTIAWTRRRAYGSTNGSELLERLWCSPGCLLVDRQRSEQLSLLGDG